MMYKDISKEALEPDDNENMIYRFYLVLKKENMETGEETILRSEDFLSLGNIGNLERFFVRMRNILVEVGKVILFA